MERQKVDVYHFNQAAWDNQVAQGNEWTLPVGPEVIAAARAGRWSLVLTPEKPVPADWYPPLAGAKVLGLASGGGQQGPILAAAGADVTIFDASAAQLAQDRRVAEREGLSLKTVQGNMADLSVFPDASFDFVYNPCSVSFVPELQPIFREVVRVLKPGGSFIAGFVNPWLYLFDVAAFDAGELIVRHPLPYSDAAELQGPALDARRAAGEALEFSHTLDDIIGGQLAAGLVITGFYEDGWSKWEPLNRYAKAAFATRAVKLAK